jgi:hypothetical protein
MKYKVYIHALNGWPIADWAVSAYMGFKEKQMDIIFFEDINEVPASKYNIVVSFIEDTNKFLAKIGVGPKMALNIPHELHQQKYLGRDIRFTDMGNFRKAVNSAQELKPVFIKPNRRSKEFIAGVMTMKETIHAFKDVEDDTPILLSDVVNFESEYRGYVIGGVLKGLKHYQGDFFVFPDTDVIMSAIRDYKSAPAGYSIDFGVTDGGKTLLVECNDGFSLGNYGLEHSIYANLLLRRWMEMTNHIDR